jgi:hypothetical protein
MARCEKEDRMSESEKRMAVYIDADQISQEWILFVFEQLAPWWNVYFRRAYGVNLSALQWAIQKHGILPVEVLPNTKGKNATDHALIIDAMKELHRGVADAFCIVSGDGDFTRLAQTLREEGKPVIGFGPQQAPLALRKACTNFSVLSDSDRCPPPPDAPGTLTCSQKGMPEAEQVITALRAIVEELNVSAHTVTVASLSLAARRRDPEFSPARYNSKNLTRLLRKLAIFDLSPIKNLNGEVGDYKISIRETVDPAVSWVQ